MHHIGESENCPYCEISKRPKCSRCGHALTGEFDEHGWTTCEVCEEKTWFGVGDYND